jgi:hypothetical protein
LFSHDEPELANPQAVVSLKETPVGGVTWMIAGLVLYYLFNKTDLSAGYDRDALGTQIVMTAPYAFALLGVLSLFVSRATLKMGVNGFEYQCCFGKTRYHWSEIGQFYVTDPQSKGQQNGLRLPWQKIVGFDLRYDKTRPLGEELFVLFMGTKNKIPGMFGLAAEDLVAAMEHRRLFAVSGAHQTSSRLSAVRSNDQSTFDGNTGFGRRVV